MQTFGIYLVEEEALRQLVRHSTPMTLPDQLHDHAMTEGVDWGSLRIRASELLEGLDEIDQGAGELAEAVLQGAPPDAQSAVPGASYIAPQDVPRLLQRLTATQAVPGTSGPSSAPRPDIAYWISDALAEARLRGMGVLIIEI
ncbi:MAG: hypothetical protein ACLFU2_13590, partial [Opitutales bacterium]